MSAVVHPFPTVWSYCAGGADAWRDGYRLRVWAHCDIPSSRCELHGWDVLTDGGLVVASGFCRTLADAQAAAVEAAR